jgi:hypothetical protein
MPICGARDLSRCARMQRYFANRTLEIFMSLVTIWH